jgi:hypothetical protein
MRGRLLSWTIIFALLAAGFGATVLALNSSLYSAGGFVRSYLETLQRGDLDAVLAIDGVEAPANARGDLLLDGVLGGFDGIRLLSDVESEGEHTVRYAYTIDGTEQISQFTVERAGTRFGLFPMWRFSVSPVATLAVTVDHDARFTANGVEATSGDYAVLVPARVILGHDTEWLEALDTTVAVTEVGATTDALVEVAPKEGFAPAATAAIASYLDTCATQTVLQPTGCPFGTTIANRLKGSPAWSLVAYPEAQLNTTDTPGTWETQRATGTAHIIADVVSLFDGTTSRLDEDVEFAGTYLIVVGLDDSLSVSLG